MITMDGVAWLDLARWNVLLSKTQVIKLITDINVNINRNFFFFFLAYFTPLQEEGLFINFPPMSVLSFSLPCNTRMLSQFICPSPTLPSSPSDTCSWGPIGYFKRPSVGTLPG